MIRSIEAYDIFGKGILLKVKFVYANDNSDEYFIGHDQRKDIKNGEREIYGFTLTGRTFRCSYDFMRYRFENSGSSFGMGER